MTPDRSQKLLYALRGSRASPGLHQREQENIFFDERKTSHPICTQLPAALVHPCLALVQGWHGTASHGTAEHGVAQHPIAWHSVA